MNIIIAILITLVFSALFSGLEIAFVSSNKLRFELDKKQKNLTSSILNIFYDNREQFISTMLVGNNVTLVIYGMKMTDMLQPYLEPFTSSAGVISFIITIISTIILIFTAEFLPKTLFRINPNFMLKIFAVPLFFIYVVLYPIAVFSTKLSVGILKMLGAKQHNKNKKHILGKIDLSYLIEESLEKTPDINRIDNEVLLFQNALDFSDVKLRDCIVPRTEIVGISIENSLDELMTKFIDSGNSKVIVYNENIDDIVGYIDSAEMFKNAENWKNSIKKMPIVPETMAANKLMDLFIKQKKNMAVVVDEFGGTSGIVTLEDIIEEIFGEIEDEHDNKEYISKMIAENQYILSGRLEIDAVNEQFNLNIPESDDYVTIAGFILYHCGKLPKPNEMITIDNFSFQIIKASNNKIDLVKLSLSEKA